MSLPKIKANYFKVTLPVAKRTIKYRPFLVGEESRLLQAKIAGSELAMGEAIANIVEIVTDKTVDPNTDSYVDVVYIFMLSRARGVSETSNIVFRCDCATDEKDPPTVKATINVTDILVDVPEIDDHFCIGRDNDTDQELWMKLRPLSYNAFLDARTNEDQLGEVLVLKSCIDSLVKEDGTAIDLSEADDESWTDFYTSMSTESYRKIEKYIAAQPRAWINAHGTCEKCGKNVNKRLEGLQNFI